MFIFSSGCLPSLSGSRTRARNAYIGVYLVTVKMAYSIRRKGQPSSMLVEGAMFAPSALGRKGNQLTLAVPVTGVRLVLNHPAPLPAMRILPPSADGLRPPASAPVIRTHCVSVCLARLRLQTWFLASTSILLRADRSVRHLPSSVGTYALKRVSLNYGASH